MNTQRFNNKSRNNSKANYQFMGFTHLLSAICDNFDNREESLRMIEIGSYMGESTMMFASSGLFTQIDVIEPHKGDEAFNDENEIDWSEVRKEFEINLRHFKKDLIIHHQDFSYNISDKFRDNSYDFIYIDADHSYESVKKDIELYLPKLKKGGIIGGHDYCPYAWPNVIKAVDETIGKPDGVVWDTSWIKII